ncbi:hypothetical protein HDU80_007302 [Chytriomyces hyalinus]|nr:hypothetical protein HDU80_007302 [Chytriomyces hyalinus]
MSGCFLLDAASVCGPQFEGFPVHVLHSGLSDMNGLAQLSKQMQTQSSYTDLEHGCKAGSALDERMASLRHQTLLACSRLVFDAINAGCAPSSPRWQVTSHGPLPCPNECSVAVESYAELMQDDSVCPKVSAVTAARIEAKRDACRQHQQALEKYNYGSCLVALPSEANTCGFTSVAKFENHCTVNWADPCCHSHVTTVPYVNNTAVYPMLSLVQAPKANTSDVVPAPNNVAPNTAVMATPWAPAVVLGSVMTGAAFVLMVAGYLVTSRSHKARNRISALADSVGSNSSNKQMSLAPSSQFIQHVEFPPVCPPVLVSSPSKRRQLQEVPQDSRMVIGVYPYTARMADELSIYPGQQVLVVDQFKDGWGHGICMDSKQQGAFPLACVSENPFHTRQQPDVAVVPDTNTHTGTRRRASYAADPDIPQPDHHAAIQSAKYSRNSTIYSIYSAYGRMDSSFVDPPSPVHEDCGGRQGFDMDDAMFVRRVIYEYDAQMEDELDLVVGESVRVLQEFDDNWAIGTVVGSGKRGMFPLVCVESLNGHGDDAYWSNTRNDQISSRTSSRGRWF